MESIRERDLHKSLKLLLKECETGLSLFVDLRLKSPNLKERPRITLSGRNPLFLKTSRPKVQFGANTYYSMVQAILQP